MKAYTLLEVVITVSIVAIIAGLGVQTYRGYVEGQREAQIVNAISSLEKAKFYLEASGKVPSLDFIGYFDMGSVANLGVLNTRDYVRGSVVYVEDISTYVVSSDTDNDPATRDSWLPITPSTNDEKWEVLRPYSQWPRGVEAPLNLFRGTDVESVEIGNYKVPASVVRSGE